MMIHPIEHPSPPRIRRAESRRRLAVVMLLGATGFAAGCVDESAANRAAADAQIMDAVAGRASAVYVPDPAAETPGSTLATYRRQQRPDYIQDLEKVKGLGTRGQRSAVHMLLAGQYADDGHDRAADVATRFGRFESDAAGLFEQVAEVGASVDQILLFEPDERPLIGKLRDQLIKVQNRLSEYETAVDGLASRIATHEANAQEHAQERAAKAAVVAEGRAEIGQAQGAAILDIADRIRLAGADMAVADAKVQFETARIQVLASEQRVLTQQRDLARASSEALTARLQAIETRHRDINGAREAEVTRFRTLLGALNTRAEALAATFDTEIAKPFDEAAATMGQAVERAETALSQASRGGRDAATLDLISASLGRVHVLVGHVLARRAYGHTLDVVAAGVEASVDALRQGPGIDLEGAATKVHANQAEAVAAVERTLTETARGAIEEGRQRAEELADGRDDDPYVAGAVQYVALFDAYAARLDGVRSSTPAPQETAERVDRVDELTDTPSQEEPTPAPWPDSDAEPAEITGDLPALPDAVVTDDTPVLVWIDGRHLTPAAIRDTVTVLLGEQGAMQAEGFVGMFEPYYNAFVRAGGTSLVFATDPEGAAGAPGETIYVSMAEGADEARLEAWLREVNKDPETTPQFERDGAWLVGSLGTRAMPGPDATDIRARVEEACQAMGPCPLLVTIVPDEGLLDAARAQEQMMPLPVPGDLAEVEPLLREARWFAIAVRLGEEVGLYTTMQLADPGAATAAAEMARRKLDESIAEMSQQGGPFAMVGPMLRGAVQISSRADRLHVDLSGPGFKGLVAMAVNMIGPMMQGGIQMQMEGAEMEEMPEGVQMPVEPENTGDLSK